MGHKEFVDEPVMGCRALGRNIEDEMILTAFDFAKNKVGAENIILNYKKGPRNTPALNWLKL